MRILAIETTEARGSVAALDDRRLVAELPLAPQQQSARSLAPGLEQLLREVHWQPRDVELVAVTRGPGSFTGLRVGLATAKAFAYATGAAILGIDTLEAIAANAPETVPQLAVAVDAQRGQIVAGRFRRDSAGQWLAVSPAELLDVDAWLGSLEAGTHLSGPILRRYLARIPEPLICLAPEFWSPTAAQVGRLAARDWAAGRRDDLWSLAPVYSRKSAAEEKWHQRHP